MIQVTRVDGSVYALNPHRILFIEESPETRITLAGGEVLIVKESYKELLNLIMQYRSQMNDFKRNDE